MMRFVFIVLITLATTAAAAPQLETLHNSRGVYVAQDESGVVLALEIQGGSWFVMTPHGLGEARDVTDVAEATTYISAMQVMAAPGGVPGSTSPLGICVAQAIQACQSFDRALCWVQFGDDQCDFACSDSQGGCDPPPHADAMTLVVFD